MKKYKNIIGVIVGISFTLFFNWRIGQYPLLDTFAYSLPFLAVSALIGFGITKIRRDKNFGIYFAVIALLFIVARI